MLRTFHIGWWLICLIIWGMNTASSAQTAPFDLQGHRGARGLLPENTLPAFEKAIALGVSTLELDVGVSKDGSVVISHDIASAFKVADNIAFLYQGHIIDQGHPSKLRHSENPAVKLFLSTWFGKN